MSDGIRIFSAEALREKVTKGAVQYMEVTEEFEEGHINGFYLRKSTFKGLGRIPKRVRVTVEAIEE